ncbi:hypothetical protein P171DRAFT_131650 [Karstenula rhodostoma CBS 690.94]|uniref:Uncharacterized protein n=1 Tax=Karstenula rhodostoma CBS 690.94 TaxID=1392251 RepID=A0A9P4U5I8_9PLEO|nr:hypothetical protein P171DRAFT_131650 [Karstenula rhodostoma CBS 690.94]
MPIQNRPNNRGMEPGTAIPSPVQRESLMLQGRQTQLRHEMQMGLNSSSDHLGEQSIKPSDSFSRPQQQQQQKQLFASDTLHRHGGQNRAPRLEKACERSEEDVDMKDALAEAEQPEPGPNMLHRSHNPGAKMPDRQHAHTDADKADRDARAEYEKQRQRFLAIMQTNGRLPAAEQAQWIEINEAELKRRKERERTLKNLRTVEKHNEPNSNVRDHCVEGEVDKPSRIQGSVECSQVQVHTTTDCQRPQQASVDEYAAEKQRREQHQDDVSAKGVDPSLHRPSHQALDRSQPLTQFKVPQVPSRAALINDRSRREETITSRASSQTLPGNSTAATDKARLNLLLLTPPNSEVSPTRKRKVIHNVSDDSDDDPEFEPPSSDDEPLLNRIRKPVVKKAKAVNGSGTAKPVSVTPKFGFKSVKRTKSNRPITPARATGKTTAPSARSKSSERALGSESPSVQAALRLHHRRAKQKALAALDEHFQRDVEFRNEEDIRKANEREQRVANSLPKTMKRVSLMPVPPSARLASGRKETSGSQEADGEVDNAVRKERKDSAYGLAHWTKDRIRGDRHLLKSQSVSSRGRGDEESESELDLSAYQWVNGRIVTQSEEMDMAEDSR